MDECHILKIKPSSKLKEFLNRNLSDLETIPDNIRTLQHAICNENTNELLLTVFDVKCLQNYVESHGVAGDLNFFEMMEGIEIILPNPSVEPRQLELEATCQRLKMEKALLETRATVGSCHHKVPEESTPHHTINRQLIAIFQFVISISVGFCFGFLGIELMTGDLDYGFQLLLGVISALIIALAEIYFLAEKLSEDTFPTTEKPTIYKNKYD